MALGRERSLRPKPLVRVLWVEHEEVNDLGAVEQLQLQHFTGPDFTGKAAQVAQDLCAPRDPVCRLGDEVGIELGIDGLGRETRGVRS